MKNKKGGLTVIFRVPKKEIFIRKATSFKWHKNGWGINAYKMMFVFDEKHKLIARFEESNITKIIGAYFQ